MSDLVIRSSIGSICRVPVSCQMLNDEVVWRRISVDCAIRSLRGHSISGPCVSRDISQIQIARIRTILNALSSPFAKESTEDGGDEG